MRGSDLEVEVSERGARISDIHHSRLTASLLTDVACDSDASIADSNDQIWPGRLDQLARLQSDGRQAVAQEGQMSQRIVGDPFALEREAERNGQRSQLIIVALAIAQQKPSEGLTCRSALGQPLLEETSCLRR